MAIRYNSVASVLLLATALLQLASLVKAQGEPEVTYNTFRNFPGRLFFFDDTTVRPLCPYLILLLTFAKSAIFFDSIDGVVYVSQDEGKSWSTADIPKGEAMQVIEHPFDNQYVRHSTIGILECHSCPIGICLDEAHNSLSNVRSWKNLAIV